MDSIHMNLRNPASYAGKPIKLFNGEGQLMKFTVGGSHISTKMETEDASDKANSTSFDYLALSFSMGKIGMGFGLMPYTSVGYKLESRGDNDVITNRYRGKGGVNKAFLGFGYQISNDLSIGADLGYNFGNIQNSATEFVYDDEGNPLSYQSKELNRSDLSGLNYNIGVSYTPMITDKFQLTSAITYSPKANLDSKNERIYSTIVTNENTGEEFPVNEIDADLAADGLSQTKLTLPSKTAFGLGIGQPRKWFVGAEYTILKTSEFNNEVFDLDNSHYVDGSKIAIGGFFIPQYNSFSNYWKRVVYRVGIRFEKPGLEINNESIDEFGISFGVGLPVGRLFSNANLGLELGRRGTVKQNLVKENFISLQISLSLNDRWFQKRKYN